MEKSKNQQEKDLAIRADMTERITNARAEVLAISVALGRWAPHPTVADAVRTILSACERLGGTVETLSALPAEYIARPDRMRPAKGWRVDLVGKHAAMFSEAYGVEMTGAGTDKEPHRVTGFSVVSVVGGTSEHSATCKLILRHDTGTSWGPVAVANVALPCAVTPQEASDARNVSSEAMPLSPAQRAALAADASAAIDAIRVQAQRDEDAFERKEVARLASAE